MAPPGRVRVTNIGDPVLADAVMARLGGKVDQFRAHCHHLQRTNINSQTRLFREFPEMVIVFNSVYGEEITEVTINPEYIEEVKKVVLEPEDAAFMLLWGSNFSTNGWLADYSYGLCQNLGDDFQIYTSNSSTSSRKKVMGHLWDPAGFSRGLYTPAMANKPFNAAGFFFVDLRRMKEIHGLDEVTIHFYFLSTWAFATLPINPFFGVTLDVYKGKGPEATYALYDDSTTAISNSTYMAGLEAELLTLTQEKLAERISTKYSGSFTIPILPFPEDYTGWVGTTSTNIASDADIEAMWRGVTVKVKTETGDVEWVIDSSRATSNYFLWYRKTRLFMGFPQPGYDLDGGDFGDHRFWSPNSLQLPIAVSA